VFDSGGGFVGEAWTDSSGVYTTHGLPSGSYRVLFVGDASGCGASKYATQFYNDKPSLASADPVTVTDDTTTSGIDAALVLWGQITGKVTDSATHTTLAGICVTVYDSRGGVVGSWATDSSGIYITFIPNEGLVPGSYRVGFASGCGANNYMPQFYSDKPSLASADPVTVTSGATTSGIDAPMVLEGQITGTVTDSATHTALAGACVTVYDSGGGVAGSAQTDSSGAYTISALPTGSYRVGFASGCGASNYEPQFYNDKASLASADPVTVTDGTTTSGIDAAMVK
jgi:uncharacterized surface anchored protein